MDLQRALDLSPEAEKAVIAEKLAAARQMQQTQHASEPIVEEPPDEEPEPSSGFAEELPSTSEPIAESRYKSSLGYNICQ